MREHSSDQSEWAEVVCLELLAGLLFGRRLDGCVDGETGVVHQHVDLVAALFELSDNVAALRAVDIELNPLSSLALDLRDQLWGLRRVARGCNDGVAAGLCDTCKGETESGGAARDEPCELAGGHDEELVLKDGFLEVGGVVGLKSRRVRCS